MGKKMPLLVTLSYSLTRSSPHTQTVGSLHRLTVSQQKAALMSKPLQQPLCGLASNSPIINGPEQRVFPLHVASEAGTRVPSV